MGTIRRERRLNREGGRVLQVMKELGIDISGQESKTLQRYRQHAFEWVITVCDDVAEACRMR